MRGRAEGGIFQDQDVSRTPRRAHVLDLVMGPVLVGSGFVCLPRGLVGVEGWGLKVGGGASTDARSAYSLLVQCASAVSKIDPGLAYAP